MSPASASAWALFLGLCTAAVVRCVPAIRQQQRQGKGLPSRSLVSRLRCIICDCDGVLFAHGKALPGVPDAVNTLKRAGKRVLFVTNSATQSRKSLQKKLTGLGFQGVDADDCVTSASAAASYLAAQCPGVRTAYCIGEQGLVDELQEAGIEALGPGDTGGLAALLEGGFEDPGLEGEGAVGAVVIGLQYEELNYHRLAKAAAYAQVRDRPFVATNLDENWPAGVSAMLPAGGACVSFVSYAAERAPDVNVGKPSRDLADLVVRVNGLDRGTTLMVGDRLNTDIKFGNSVGMWTMLVLTGCHTREHVNSAEPDEVPHFVGESLSDLAAVLVEAEGDSAAR